MRIIDSQRIENECSSCGCTFTSDRDEDGWPAQDLCSLCSETFPNLKQTMMAEREHSRHCLVTMSATKTDAQQSERERQWWEAFLSFPFKQLPAPEPVFHNYCCDCEICGSDHPTADCPDLKAWREHQDLMDAADQAAYYSPKWEDNQ